VAKSQTRRWNLPMVKHSNRYLLAFGSRVRALRLEAGTSQEQLAHDAGIDRTYFGGIERGKYNPSLLHIKRIASALGVAASDLLIDDE
jgi:transcriptional regulator with XRE-family HTH domain